MPEDEKPDHISDIKGYVQSKQKIMREMQHTDGPEWQSLLIMDILLHIYDKLESIDQSLESIASDSTDIWNKLYNP